MLSNMDTRTDTLLCFVALWLLLCHQLVRASTVTHLVVHSLTGSYQLQNDTTLLSNDETIREVQWFRGDSSAHNHFGAILIEGDHMVLGARNLIYNVSLSDMKEQWRIDWSSTQPDIQSCLGSQNSTEMCQNYIRVIQRKADNHLYVCGTNAFKPYCKTFLRQEPGHRHFTIATQVGRGKCPHDPRQRNTALLIDDRLYSATTADRQSRDALIFASNTDSGLDRRLAPELRTQQYDAQWLNEPEFVHSFHYQNMVYFLFSETAVEYINCGKKRFSRIGRACKNDQGGKYVLTNIWTSFFKARLNCSMSGEFPFYFDEIQSSTDIGSGNYMPTLSYQERTDMFYAVFNTPNNSIHGSAVCAFRMSDVLQVFEGPFKEQKFRDANWLPVSDVDTPHPHPAKTCANDSTQTSDVTLNFVKTHQHMDGVVPSFGPPVFKFANNDHRITQIAVDWQVLTSDGRYYDVIFLGTDDGRVIKTVNKGVNQDVDFVVVEDIEVFADGSPVTNLQVYQNLERGEQKLLVVSENTIKGIPLQRCHLQYTCGDCVKLQDPYCSWHDGRCQNTRLGLQNLFSGRHRDCPAQPSVDTPRAVESTTAPATCPPCPACTTVAPSGDGDQSLSRVTPRPNQTADARMMNTIYAGPTPTQMQNEIPIMGQSKTDPFESAMSDRIYTSRDLAVAVVVTFLVTSILFLIPICLYCCWSRRRYMEEAKQTDIQIPGKQLEAEHPSLHSKARNEYEIELDALKKKPNNAQEANRMLNSELNTAPSVHTPVLSAKDYMINCKKVNNELFKSQPQHSRTVHDNLNTPSIPPPNKRTGMYV